MDGMNEWSAFDEPVWISVDDNMPKATGDYQIAVEINRCGAGMFREIRVANYNTVLKRWTVYESPSCIIGNISHWRKLPRLPRE